MGGERWIRTTVGVRQQIYSLPHLATLVSPQLFQFRADRRIRTPDLLFTKQLLYRLSYIGNLYTLFFGTANIADFDKTPKKYQLFFAECQNCLQNIPGVIAAVVE